jgi:hypothetical protein
MKFILFALLGCLGAQSAFAQYRCAEGGKTVFQERPCAATEASPRGASDKVVGETANSAYATTNGAWRGQVQFMAKAGNAVIPEAHVVGPFVIEIDPRGKVSGSASEAGCLLKGIAKPGVFPNIAELDVTLSKCNYPPFNRAVSRRVV